MKKEVSIILPALNEGKTVGKFIRDLRKLNIFREIIVVDNNSTDNTKKEVLKNRAVYAFEKTKGYGAATKRGLLLATSKYLMTSEPEGSFNAKDSLKILKNLNKYDAVFTSRTSNKMNFYLKYGNIFYARILSFLFNGPRLTDVGSTFRVFPKVTFDKFKKKINSIGPEFQIELTINLIKEKLNIIEIPIKHKKRFGKSHYTGNFFSSLMVAIAFTKIVILKFFKIT
jgi:glycosyltransferase involved in cell wall biosynthesis